MLGFVIDYVPFFSPAATRSSDAPLTTTASLRSTPLLIAPCLPELLPFSPASAAEKSDRSSVGRAITPDRPAEGLPEAGGKLDRPPGGPGWRARRSKSRPSPLSLIG